MPSALIPLAQRRCRALLLLGALLSIVWPTIASAAVPEVPDSAVGSAAIHDGEARVTARLLVESEQVQSGRAVRAGVHFEVARGWHVYWRNPGDSALPTRISWQIEQDPEARIGEIAWPAPKVFHEIGTGFTTFGYSNEVLLAQTLELRAQIDGPIDVVADVRFLVCEEICIPGRVSLQRSLLLGAEPEADPAVTKLFDEYAARVPLPAAAHDLEIETLYSQTAVRPGDSFVLGIVAAGCKGDEGCNAAELARRDPAELFLPYDALNPTVRPLGAQPREGHPGQTIVAVRGNIEAGAPPRTVAPLRGLLAVPGIGDDGESAYVEVDLPFPTSEAESEITLLATDWLDPALMETPASVAIHLPLAFALALLGGLILNLMPCVLPVLAIKLVALSEQVHASRGRGVRLGVAYLAGIEISMLLLAGFVIALRQAGVAVGWGFQFQEPMFMVAIAILVVAMACNLFGFFEMGWDVGRAAELGQQGGDLRRSFFDGFLAVALSTPCSAPFLGTAVGFAFAGGVVDIVAIFSAIGLGLALPFVAASLVPGLARVIPAPGPWMTKLRAVLGLALLGTAVWLLWLIDRAAGSDAQLLVVIVLALVAAGSFGFGRLQRRAPGEPQRVAVATGGVATVLTLLLLPIEPLPRDANAATNEASIPWSDFDPEAIRTTLDEGRPVFVYFTADWCITCKVNEQLVLEDESVVDAFEEHGIVTFRADWTLRDETIRRELARHGKAGVPVYLVYDPSRPERPLVLPELITVDAVLKALERAARAAAG